MSYPDGPALAEAYAGNQRLIEKLLADLTHEQSVVQPPFPGNSLNWVAGHILNGRERALRLLGAVPVLSEEDFERYATGSPPVTVSGDAVPIDKLRAGLDTAVERLGTALQSTSEEQLAEIVTTPFGPLPRGRYLNGLHWHETFHIGQLELLRSLCLNS